MSGNRTQGIRRTVWVPSYLSSRQGILTSLAVVITAGALFCVSVLSDAFPKHFQIQGDHSVSLFAASRYQNFSHATFDSGVQPVSASISKNADSAAHPVLASTSKDADGSAMHHNDPKASHGPRLNQYPVLDIKDSAAAESDYLEASQTSYADAAEASDSKTGEYPAIKDASPPTVGKENASVTNSSLPNVEKENASVVNASLPTVEKETSDSNISLGYGPASPKDGVFNCGSCKVHICGYVRAYSRVAQALFPERELEEFLPSSTVVRPHDIAVVSGTCRIQKYSGAAVLYIDPEQGKIYCRGGHPRVYYLGIEEPPYIPPEMYTKFLGHIPWSDVSNTPIIFGYSANDFFMKNYTKESNRSFLVYVHQRCMPHRERAYDSMVELAMEEKWPLPDAGNCTGNYSNTHVIRLGMSRQNMYENPTLFAKWKFVLCMENTYVKGYITEKIANAFKAGAIPIYWGTEEIFKIFNRDAFIYYNITDPKPAVEKVRHLMKNPEAYQSMLDQPTLAHGAETLEDHFSVSDDVGGGKLKKRIRMMVFNQSSELIIRNFDDWSPPIK